MRCMRAESCMLSREMLRGMSSESTTPASNNNDSSNRDSDTQRQTGQTVAAAAATVAATVKATSTEMTTEMTTGIPTATAATVAAAATATQQHGELPLQFGAGVAGNDTTSVCTHQRQSAATGARSWTLAQSEPCGSKVTLRAAAHPCQTSPETSANTLTCVSGGRDSNNERSLQLFSTSTHP